MTCKLEGEDMKIDVSVDLEIYDKLNHRGKSDFLIAIVEDARDSPEQMMANIQRRWNALGKEYLARCVVLEKAIHNEELREKVDDVVCSIMRMLNMIIPFDIEFEKDEKSE